VRTRLQVPGVKKLISPSIHAADAGGDNKCCGLFTSDARIANNSISVASFLVDTGSAISVLPRRFQPHTCRHTNRLSAANGSIVYTYGTIQLSFSLTQLGQTFLWTFTVADVTQPILGADFFDHFQILVDCRNKKLIANNRSSDSSVVQPVSNCINLIQSPEADFIKQIMDKFPNVLSRSTHPSQQACISSHVIITTNCAPVRQRRRELSQERRLLAEKEFKELEESGVIRRSASPWAAPLQIVTKKDGSIRICGDYRGVNKVTVPDAYPMPLISDILQRFAGCTVFSSLDLAKAYHQIPVDAESIPKTAIITPFGLFEYLRMPFGLRNASQTFQRHIDMVLQGLSNVAAYVDDIIIASPDAKQHRKHLSETLAKLNTHNLQIKLEKCRFFQSSVEFLGHTLSKDGIRPLESRVKAIRDFPRPDTVTSMRSFLGMVNYCRRFLPNLSATLAPLTAFSSGPKKSKIQWTAEADAAFNQIKEDMLSMSSLHYPDSTLPLTLTTDASNTAIGAVLMQVRGSHPEPIEFYSHKLSPAQTRYSTFDRELLALYLSTRHFEHLMIARNTTVYTDHKPLLQCTTMRTPSPRQQRQISYLSQFNMEIKHIRGADNVIADCLSRADIASLIFEPLFTMEILEQHPPTEKDLNYFKVPPTARGKVFFDTSFPGCPRPILSQDLRAQAFQAVHNVSHPGSKATYELLRTKVVWPCMRRDVKIWCRTCFSCQKSKITRHVKPPVLSFPTGSRFDTVHIDIVGPLPNSNGFSYILTMIDRNTRWPEAFPLRTITTETIVDHFINHWVARFGIPKRIITDQGRQFESDLFNSLVKRLGIQKIRTTAFHPQANGLVERLHRTLKNSLRAMATTKDWSKQMPYILLGWRNIPNSRHGTSPAQLLFGTNTSFVNELFFNEAPQDDALLSAARAHFLQADRKPTHPESNKIFVPKELASAKFVWLQRESPTSLQDRYTGPHRLIKFTAENNTALIDFQGTERTVNICKLKPCIHIEDMAVDTPTSALKRRSVSFSPWVQYNDLQIAATKP
jgi:cleavage and polyadenylation specificity factor subunit 1